MFSVDVLGEGVDVPSVDTVLLLRPTDSATVFTQQLGRGLRRADGKPYLTVIDLIGQQHRQFRFDRRLGALIDRRRGPLERQIEDGFPFLPSGCYVELDRQSEEIVLGNLRDAARLQRSGEHWSRICEALPDATLSSFLRTDESDAARRLSAGRTTAGRKLRRDAGRRGPTAERDADAGAGSPSRGATDAACRRPGASRRLPRVAGGALPSRDGPTSTSDNGACS